MRIERALSHRDALVRNVKSALSHAKHFSLPSDEVCAKVNEVFSAAPSDLPQWAIEYARGYRYCLHDTWYTDGSLVHGGFINNRFYSVVKARDDYYEKHDIGPKQFCDEATDNGFYWSHSLEPYSVKRNTTA